MSGFRTEAGTADAIGDVAKNLESAEAAGDITKIVFFDIFSAFDFVLHVTILNQLETFGADGRTCFFIEVFLCDWSFVVTACGTVSSLRKFTDGVPQGSGLSRRLCNLAMADLLSMV